MQKAILVILSFGLIVMLGVGISLLVSSMRGPSTALELPPIPVKEEPPDENNTFTVPLYFLSSDHRLLVKERRTLVLSGRLEDRLETLVKALIDGPSARNLLPTIPEGTRLQSLFWDEAQKCVVLSLSREFIDSRPGHALAEWASIYSLVNTLADHDSAIQTVQILVEGELVEDDLLWDLTEPLAPDKTFVFYDSAESLLNPGQ
ncbi:MAG TPA: GerMN domain-containing protein [bacterium]|nr:GerMN domain-containing protein [bacterium]HQL63069.1 GerMN domain-containing protein [bacterium]